MFIRKGHPVARRRGRLQRLLLCAVAAAVAAGLAESAPPAVAAAPNELQAMIDRAAPGDVLTLDAGVYEGAVLIDKPLTLAAEGEAVLSGGGDGPVVTVRTDGAELVGLTIRDRRARPDSAAVVVEGDRNRLQRLVVETAGTGVQLREADGNKLEQLVINGLSGADVSQATHDSPARRGNGIDLWKSHDNLIEGNRISRMFDGIYVESSHGNRIVGNEVTRSRYGYHIMFGDDNRLNGNNGFQNVTGAMVMGAKRTEVIGNTFTKQTESVNAQGLLLFDAFDTVVKNNIIEGNRVGIYVEAAGNNEITDNTVSRNFIGMQLLGADENRLTHNTFIANVAQAQALGSRNNRMEANYWDDFQGIDLTGNGVSNLPYRVNPFFLSLSEKIPPFQVFFGSPGMRFFESLFHHPTELWLKDDRPLLKPPEAGAATGPDPGSAEDAKPPSGFVSGFAGALLAATALVIFIQSGRRKS